MLWDATTGCESLMYRQYSVDDQNLARVGILFCFALCMGVFFLALFALPFERTLAGQLQQFGNTVDPSRKRTGELLTFTPRVPASGVPNVATIPPTPPIPLVTPTPVEVAIPASAVSHVAPRSTPVPSSPTPVPDLKTYTVQAGDTLYSIARRHGASAQALAALNGLSSTGVVKVGQRLEVP